MGPQIEQTQRVDRITRRFYRAFKREREVFVVSIDGIPQQANREWYASVMLNRLMFLYFLQQQGFLDNDRDYLTNRLKTPGLKGTDKCHSYYRRFLRRLFHEGLGQPKDQRAAGLVELVGNLPFLNGGIFDEHELEVMHPGLHIPDEAFERIFGFFNQYQWSLDEYPLTSDREINPDVLGYIFEKHINQKQMGAYYTKEDITEYIARNTIVPFLLDASARAFPDHFLAIGPAWELLRNDPDAYLFAAMRHGVDLELPRNIAAGLEDVDRRTDWNKPASAGFGLPTETWREHIARRRRCLDLRQKQRAGEIHAVNDLITYNLDIRRFADDLLRTCHDPALLGAFWQQLTKMSVLDPTCGSGAFLFAALNVLASLYDACLDRMQEFVPVAEYTDFRRILEQIEGYPNRRYFVLKSILIQNLYGVDLMREAVEICKLRLCLKLVAQVRRVEQLEPLPDIDFNLRVGNLLVGFVSSAGDQTPEKNELRQPFHWFAEFPEIMNRRGFDVIIGNPPYVEISDVKDQYTIPSLKMTKTGNLFAVCLERLFELEQAAGRFGVIVPLSAVCTPRMFPLMKLIGEKHQYLCQSHFAVRPAKLFAGVDMNLTIFLGAKEGENGANIFSTGYNRWKTEFRPFLFDTLTFQPTKIHQGMLSTFKIGSELERKLIDKLLGLDNLGSFAIPANNSESIYYHSGGRYFRKCLRERLSNEYKELKVKRGLGGVSICLLSSSIYYWFWIAISDCYHVTKRDICTFPVPNSLIGEKSLDSLAEKLLADLWDHSRNRNRTRADGSQQTEVNFQVGRSKPLLDQIDRILAKHYGFTGEELDFLLNFDAKFRSDLELATDEARMKHG